jgi:hypothetical protein
MRIRQGMHACAVGFCQVDDKRIVTYTERRQRRLLVRGVGSNQQLIFHFSD